VDDGEGGDRDMEETDGGDSVLHITLPAADEVRMTADDFSDRGAVA
jgi:hypothetical protein